MSTPATHPAFARPEVVPRRDLEEHVIGFRCACGPEVREGVIVHTSYDGREVGTVLGRKPGEWAVFSP